MNMSFWSHCQDLVRRLQKRRLARPRERQPGWCLTETLEDRALLSSTPAIVADIAPGPDSSIPGHSAAIGSTIYFRANDGIHGNEWWRSDGTAAGTTMVKDINPGSGDSNPGNFANVNGTLYFIANDGVHGSELWKSDGTAAGTMLLKDIHPGSGDSTLGLFTDVNGMLYFSVANDGVHPYQLWKSDGTTAGTTMVKEIPPQGGINSLSDLTNLNGTLFFFADGTTPGLWKSDGTEAGTVRVSETGGSQLTNVNGTLFFTSYDANGTELWKSDGTAAGTTMVKDIYPGESASAGYPGGIFYYPNSSYPGSFTDFNGTLFFTANDGVHGYELWKSDGTADGTTIVKDILLSPYTNGSNPFRFTDVNGTLFFMAHDTAGTRLWKSDGTEAGTVAVSSRNFGPWGGYDLGNVNGSLFFIADDGHGWEVWKSDGTDGGTVMVTDFDPTDLHLLGYVNDNLFFRAGDADHGTELWALNVAPAPSLGLSGFPATTTAGSAGSFTITAKNADGTTNTGYVGTVHFTSTDPQAVLPANYTFTAADHGVHTFTASLKTAGYQAITATDTQAPGMDGSESNILVQAAAASTMTVGGFPSTATAGVAGNVTVTVKDPYGNFASGYTGTVRLTSTDSKAVLPADYTFTAADAGTHTFSVTLKTAGTHSITATDMQVPGMTGAESNILVKAAAASTVTVGGFPSTTTAGVAGNVTVTLKDRYGNIATAYTGTVRLTSSDAKAALPANYKFTAADAGNHTFSVTLKTAGTQSITVTDTTSAGLTGTQGGITVKAGAASKFLISAPSSVSVGVPFSLTLTVQDAYGNVITGYTGTVRFTSTDSTAPLPANYTFTAAEQGVHTFTGLILRKKGNQKITITDTLNSSLTGSVAINVR